MLGIYPPIPSVYSEDLASMIKALLQLNAKRRLSTDEILNMLIVQKKVKDLGLSEELVEVKGLSGNELLGTIQIPKNLRILRDKLPKPHYYNSLDAASEVETKFLPSIQRSEQMLKPSDSRNVIKRQIVPNKLTIEPEIREAPKSSQRINLNIAYLDSYRKASIAPYINSIEEKEEETLLKRIDERVKELPELKKRAPIRRPPPRIQKNNHNNILNPLYGMYIPSSVRRLEEPAQPAIGNRKARYRKIYEEIIRQREHYPVVRKYRSPVIQNVHKNEYHVYNSPVIVQPSWWG